MRGGPPRNRRRAASYDGSKTCGTIGGRDTSENTPSLRLPALQPDTDQLPQALTPELEQ